jgi:exopolysaccharide production protein ExoZ
MREHFGSLQALRGVACLLVVAYHVADAEAGLGLGFNPLRPVRWFGYAGVDLFFVLSGFIIASTSRPDLGRPGRLGRFAFRRLWRIFPAYWAALVPAVLVYAAVSPEPVFGPHWLGEWRDTVLLLPQAIVPRFLPVAWTLSYELMFYLAFAGLFLLPQRAAMPAVLAWAAVVVGATAAGVVPEHRLAALPLRWFVLEFLAGALLAWRPVRLSRRQGVGVVGLAAAWVGLGSAVCYDPDHVALAGDHVRRVLVFGGPAVLLVAAAVGRERAGARPGWRRLAAVGDASYSIYLVHVPALIVTLSLGATLDWPHTRVAHAAWLGAMLVAGVGAGLLFYRWVERPLLNAAKRKTTRGETAREIETSAPVRVAA